MPDDPLDLCPYAKPFPDDFDECGTYAPRLAFPTDVAHRPLKPVWTCAHFRIASRDKGTWYGACGLGTAEDRARWLEGSPDLRVVLMAKMRREASEWAPALQRRLVAARGTAETDALRDALLARFSLLVKRYARQLQGVGVEPNDLEAGFRSVVDSYLEGRSLDPFVSQAEISGFSDEVAFFFRPDLAPQA